MKLTLVVATSGSNQGKAIPILPAQFLIGRHLQCQLRPSNPLISDRHCALLRREGKAFLRDLGSTNGTFVNDRQIKGKIELLDGDELRVGPLAFTVRCEAAAPIARPTPLPPTRDATQKRGVPAARQAPAPEPEQPAGEEDAAALLLSMQDEGAAGGTADGIPEGNTMFDLPSTDEAPRADRPEEKHTRVGDTSFAARTILDKYLKRPRNA
jgi:pSer/pThr/pTyr-binding forkhead associated (FHA) protein